MTIRVLVADDQPEMREAVVDLISSQPQLEIVGVAADACEAVDLASKLSPDIALLDVKMSGGGGPAAAREIKHTSPHTQVIALSAYSDRGAITQMLHAGAVAYLIKGSPAADIVDAITRASSGLPVLNGVVVTDVVDALVEKLDEQEIKSAHQQKARERIESVLGDPESVTVLFQPIVELEGRRVVGFEALSRFGLQPERSPDRWFAEADEVGLGVDLDLMAIGRALSQLPSMPSEMKLFLNAAPRTALTRAFLELISLARPDQVVVELSERAPVDDYEVLNSTLQDMRDRGLSIAVDDAGAGFASLKHILALKPDIIKLDLSLTHDISEDPSKRALAVALSAFAREIGASIVAEGIETAQELELLTSLGFALGQGFLLGRPGHLGEKE